MEIKAALYNLAAAHIDNINHQSKPGYPLGMEPASSTNQKVLGDQEVKAHVLLLATERAYIMMTATEAQRRTWADDPIAAISDGVCSPVSTFLKDDPTKLAKVREKRFRVINCLDLVDQLVERMIFETIPTHLKKQFPAVPALLGLGTSPTINQVVGGRYEQISKENPLATPFAGDVKGWDAGVSAQSIHAGMRVAVTLCGAAGTLWEAAAHTWCDLRVHCAYQVNGYLYAKNRRGQMPSGTMLTTWLNCFIRTICASLTGARACILLGDDCVEWHVGKTLEDIIDAYARLGMTIRDATFADHESFNFCSHTYRKINGTWEATLDQWAKAMFKLLTHKTANPAAIHGVLDALSNHSVSMRLQFLKALLATFASPITSN